MYENFSPFVLSCFNNQFLISLDIRVDWEVFEDAPQSEKLVDFITCFGRAFPPRDSLGNEIFPASPAFTGGNIKELFV